MNTTTDNKTDNIKIHQQTINFDNVFMIILLMITLFGHLSIFYKLIH